MEIIVGAHQICDKNLCHRVIKQYYQMFFLLKISCMVKNELLMETLERKKNAIKTLVAKK